MRQLLLITCCLAAAAAAVGSAVAEDKAKEAPPLKVHMISGSKEYKSEPSLKAFKTYLEAHYPVTCTLSLGQDGGKDLPNLEALDDADVMLVFCRRQKIDGEQIERIKAWCKAGKPVVGLRTASHAFQKFLEMDRDVFGGSYKGHGKGEPVQVKVHEANKGHPILTGVSEWQRDGKLYRNPDNAEDAILLLTGTGETSKDTQPLAWARVYDKDADGRAFYTGMGYPHDFESANFQRVLVNAIFWTAKRPIPAKPAS